MDKKSKIFFLVFSFLLIGSVLATYYRYIIVKDYVIEAQVSCDPMVEKCFILVCDSESGEECTGNSEEDTSYYKLLHRNAKNIPLCDPQESDCLVSVCQAGEEDCRVVFCDASMEDSICSDPETYMNEHPVVKELPEEGSSEESETIDDSSVEAEGSQADSLPESEL